MAGKILFLLTGMMTALSVLPAAAQWHEDDDARCRSWGAAVGTQAYFECRSMLDRQREASGSSSPGRAAPPREANVSDGEALALCEQRARRSPPYPIERLASKNVFPGLEKRASLSFRINKPGTSLAFWNVDCKFRNGRMTSFDAR